jgi:hypothetical protein
MASFYGNHKPFTFFENDEMEVRIKHGEFKKLIEEKIKERMTDLKAKNNEIIETAIEARIRNNDIVIKQKVDE